MNEPTEENTALPVVVESEHMAPLTAQEIKAQVTRIQEIMRAVMVEGVHWGKLPGVDKPVLLLPGAQKLGVTFRLAPSFEVERIDLGNGHEAYQVACTLVHIPTGRILGQGVGSCSTMESKYRYRQGERLCPHCGKAAIIKGKAEYGGGWLCFAKKGGCGAKFTERDEDITSQPVGRVENPDIWDLHNTVLKMSKKRAYVDATLTATAASDIFTQDLEQDEEGEPQPLKTVPQPPPPPAPVGPPPVASGGQRAARQTKAEWPETQRTITESQIKFLMAKAESCHVDELILKDYLDSLGFKSRKEIPVHRFQEVLDWVQANEDDVP